MDERSRNQFTMRSLLILMVASAVAGICIQTFGAQASLPYIGMTALCFGGALIVRWLVAGVKMTENDPTRPIKLEAFTDNYQASVLVSRLKEHNIKAVAVGGFVSGFQAESPGYVDVVVVQSDFERAKSLYGQWQSEDQSSS